MALVPSILLTTISLLACRQERKPVDLLTDGWIEVLGDSIVDFGTYHSSQGDKKQANFVIKNTGSEAFVIQSINTGCGCTSASFRKEPVAPGDTAHITAFFNGTGLALGAFYKELRVTSNARSGLLHLGIKGNRLK